MKTPRQRRRRTTALERAQILTDFQSSGMPQRDYAAKHGIGYSTFCGWVREHKISVASSQGEDNAMFVEVGRGMVTMAGGSAATPAFVVRLSDKVGVEFFPGYATSDLHAVLALAQTARLT